MLTSLNNFDIGLRMMKIISIIAVAALGISLAMLPLKELISFLDFKFFPESAKFRQVVRLSDKAGHHVVVVGTIHYDHIGNDHYSFWNLKSVLEILKPELVLVEFRPEANSAGRLGEGPIEMPFIALTAKQFGLRVDGMDDWSEDFETRENHMVENVKNRIGDSRLTLVFTGYSHLPGFVRRLRSSGFSDQPMSKEEIVHIFSMPVEQKFPDGLAVEYKKIAAWVESGPTKYNLEWARRRKKFAEDILKGAH